MRVLLLLLGLLVVGAIGFYFWQESPQREFKLVSPVLLPSPPAANQKFPFPEISVWIPYWEEKRALGSLEDSAEKIKTISPMWYKLTSDGQLQEIPSSHKKEILDLAKKAGIPVIPTIGNDFDPQRVNLYLARYQVQESENLVEIAKQKGFGGWDLDWEEIDGQDKEQFSAFVSSLAEKLHRENLKLIVTVHAQTGTTNQWVGTKGQDLKVIGEAADQVRIMAYDFHSSTSHAGPVTPLDKLQEALSYNLSVIPREKIIIGLPTYGYDWVGEKGEPLQFTNFEERLNKYQVVASRDKDSMALTAQYRQNGENHTVWFEDAQSLAAKIKLAQSFGVSRFCLWHLGGEDPAIWQNLR